MTERKRTKLQERHHTLMMKFMGRERTFFDYYSRARSMIPDGWEGLQDTAPVKPHKTKITIRLDEDVARWYRHIGYGYQGRINGVLRCYMDAVLSKYVEQDGDRDMDGRPI
ncbi:MAG: BrnA antitoxin family protein [Pseudomonadota bacterium]